MWCVIMVPYCGSNLCTKSKEKLMLVNCMYVGVFTFIPKLSLRGRIKTTVHQLCFNGKHSRFNSQHSAAQYTSIINSSLKNIQSLLSFGAEDKVPRLVSDTLKHGHKAATTRGNVTIITPCWNISGKCVACRQNTEKRSTT